jgi:hypothetical protein
MGRFWMFSNLLLTTFTSACAASTIEGSLRGSGQRTASVSKYLV